jgi:GMP synthase (glutamine-hydrolysing)
MILIIRICRFDLHYFEFVKPVEDILKKNKIEFITIFYSNITESLLQKADKIIICGTSLKDNNFVNNLKYFDWIKDFDKPILGICGGMQILGLIFNGKLSKNQEIGLTNVSFKKDFLGLNNDVEVYELHNYCIESNEYNILAYSEKCSQAAKHKTKPFYGVLFHPEVRNKNFIKKFATF